MVFLSPLWSIAPILSVVLVEPRFKGASVAHGHGTISDTMTNAEIARVFERVGMLLELQGEENPFRIRAYERAVLVVGNLTAPLRDIYDRGGVRSLQELPGIGEDLAQKIEELLKTGKLQYLKNLEKCIPAGLLAIMEIEGIGQKKAKFLWKTFGVESIADLSKLLASGKLEDVNGWGGKSVANLRRGIAMHARMNGRMPIGDASPLAEEILQILRKANGVERVEIAGSLRRRKDTVGDLDFLATSTKPEEVMDIFCSLPQVARVIAKGSTKSTVFLKEGLDADIRVVDPKVFGAALHYFTGSKDHNVHIRKLGIRNGFTISEYGVFRGTAKRKGSLLAARTEEDVYRAVGLPYIEPELREDRGEIEAAMKGELPKLIEVNDIRGDLHCHSNFSDGADTMIDMAKAAKEADLLYIALTDHSSPMGMVKGIKKENISQYLKKIEEARKAVRGIHILSGAEVDILADGRLYLPDDILAKLDWVVAAVHSHFRQSREITTKRLLRALENPYVKVLGHPTTRMLGEREGIDFDVEAVLKEAKKQGKYLELNASKERLDLPDIHLRHAKEFGVKICINSDAHSIHGFSYEFGISQARRGWLEKGDVANTGARKI